MILFCSLVFEVNSVACRQPTKTQISPRVWRLMCDTQFTLWGSKIKWMLSSSKVFILTWHKERVWAPSYWNFIWGKLCGNLRNDWRTFKIFQCSLINFFFPLSFNISQNMFFGQLLFGEGQVKQMLCQLFVHERKPYENKNIYLKRPSSNLWIASRWNKLTT